jgi:ASC-1-like (ASCH) protein
VDLPRKGSFAFANISKTAFWHFGSWVKKKIQYKNNCMRHFTLNSPWYELVRDGRKLYEGRRALPSILSLIIGERISISHHTDITLPSYEVIVTSLARYNTFEEALTELPIDKVLPLPGITVEEGVKIYQQYVSLATQKRDGVILIGVKAQPFH